jgi:mono/diheme cytochrome c family protein
MGLGIILLFQTQPVSPNLVNPIPANTQSVVAGKNLFTRRCVACHGISGRGDGPVGLTLNPRPADLTQHAIPGVHTDAQLFQFLTDGVPTTRMPSFKSSLSETDRWNLVNFIRTLAQK